MMKTILVVVALAFAGCGISQDGGGACQLNADCDVGLSCFATSAAGSGGACLATGKKVCTKQCVTDAECLKSAPACRTQCDGLKTCGVVTR